MISQTQKATSALPLQSFLFLGGKFSTHLNLASSQLYKPEWESVGIEHSSHLDDLSNSRKLFFRVLEHCLSVYRDDPLQEDKDCPRLLEAIEIKIKGLSDDEQRFLFDWPYFKEFLNDLVESLHNNFRISEPLQALNKSIDRAMLSRKNGLLIPTYGVFVVNNEIYRPTDQAITIIENAFDRIASSEELAFAKQNRYINLCPLEDYIFGAAYSYAPLTDLNHPFTTSEAINPLDLITNLSQTLVHEGDHHSWNNNESNPEVCTDYSFEFPEDNPLAINETPTEWLRESRANLRDLHFAAQTTNNPRQLNRRILELTLYSIRGMNGWLTKLPVLTPLGNKMLEKCIEAERRLYLDVVPRTH